MGAKLAAASGGAAGLASTLNPYAALAGAVLGASPASTPDNVHSGSGSYAAGPFVVGAKIVGQGNEAGSTGASQAANPVPGQTVYGVPGISSTLPSWLPLAIIGVAALGAVVLIAKK